ncbi:MAG TPA: hypothetical protein VFI24_09020 [Pyrinomonadaceae bacterium]|nr:hypothetical protein [Pyrinomonadaceae bacterium]
MYIRFYSGVIDERSHIATGLFNAASELRWANGLSDHDFDALTELKFWFNEHLESPFDYLSRARRYDRAVCWFKSTAQEHLTPSMGISRDP